MSDIYSTEERLTFQVRAKTVVGFYFEAVRQLMAVLRKDAAELKGTSVKRTVVVDGSADRTMLLIDFLSEVLKLSNSYREIYTNVSFKKLTETDIVAELTGCPVEQFDATVSAVTYHDADVRKDDEGWWNSVVTYTL